MKKRAALILAFVMLTGVLAGLMPVSAAAVADYYYSIAPVSSGAGYSFTIPLKTGETVREGSYSGIVQVTLGTGTATVIGINKGNVTIEVTKDSAVVKRYHVTVTDAGSGALEDVTSASVEVSMKLGTNYDNVFTGEKVTLTAVVKNSSGTTLSPSKLRYSWSVSSGISATIATSSNGSVATLTLNSVPFDEKGTAINVELVVYGANGSSKTVSLSSDAVTDKFKVYKSNGQALASGVKAYCGKVVYTYLDRDNGNAPISNPASIGTVAEFTNLGRTYTAPVGRSVGMVHYMADAAPRTVTFYPGSIMTYNIVAGIKKGRGSSTGTGTGTSSGYGFLTLPNGYTIIESIEAANNLAIMKPGDTQQITTAMLGGVPPTAPLMSYRIADPAIATVSSTGLITALKTGATMLEVYCNNQKVIYKYLFVLDDADEVKEPEGLVIKTSTVTRTLATQKNVKFRIKADNITFNGKKIAHSKLEWSSSKTSVATVDQNGYVRIRAKGTCYIYATYTDANGEEHTARFKVVVK